MYTCIYDAVGRGVCVGAWNITIGLPQHTCTQWQTNHVASPRLHVYTGPVPVLCVFHLPQESAAHSQITDVRYMLLRSSCLPHSMYSSCKDKQSCNYKHSKTCISSQFCPVILQCCTIMCCKLNTHSPAVWAM